MGTAKGDQNNGTSPANGTSTSQTPANNKSSSNNEPDQYPEGTRLGHYVLGKFKYFLKIQITGKALGKWTFGKVKMANHTLTGEKVAVKILEKSRIKDKKDIERISREIKILKKVRHPNII